MTVSLGIDISLVLVFIIVLFICYKRGVFKTIVTVLKTFATLIATFYIQDLVRPLIAQYIPIDINTKINTMTTVVTPSVFEKYFQVLVGSLISSVIIFIALYIIFTFVSNLLLDFLDRFSVTSFIDRLGGLLTGFVLASLVVLVFSYVITILLLIYNSTVGIGIIYNSLLLKNIVANNIKFILDNIISVL